MAGPSRACSFCGQDAETPIQRDGEDFCSAGCANAAQQLDAHKRTETVEASPVSDSDARAFFHVAGMHGPTCEAFLERRARSLTGVKTVDASYVTETIYLTYDPDTVTEDDLRTALSVVGYRLVSREETSGESATTVLADPRDRAERTLDDLLGFRYVAGVVFATFLLLPYVVVLYPAQFSLLPVEFFEDGAISGGALPLLVLLAGTSGVVILFTGLPLLRGAYVSLLMRRPSTDLVATLTVIVAFVYGTVAVLAGRIDLYFDLAIVVAAVVVAASYYESLVKREAMERLTDITLARPHEARVLLPSGTLDVELDDLRPDDLVLVREGERVPVDGELTEGHCTVDESVVTGESRPVQKRTGDQIVGGSVVTGNAAVVRVGDPPTSSIDRLTTAVWRLQSATHGLQRRADRVAGRIVPVVVGAAVVTGAVLFGLGWGTVGAGLAALAVIIVFAPWGLALSTPLTVATNLRAALSHDIVISDETVFERLGETDTVVFDKTGTLTAGEMVVVDADAPPETLAAAALLEQRASHPVATAITEAFADSTDTGDERGNTQVTGFESHSRGVEGTVGGVKTLVGHPALFAATDWNVPTALSERVERVKAAGNLPVVVGQSGEATGLVVLADKQRSGWEQVITRLAESDISVVILTGDDETAAKAFERHPAVESVFAGVPPTGKTEVVKRVQATNHVTMVGDGTNDAPALAQADLGIALGSGTALASDAADVALAADELDAVEKTFALAQAANRRVTQNALLALSYNAVAALALVGGVLNPVTTMFGVVVAGTLLGLNSSRSLL